MDPIQGCRIDEAANRAIPEFTVAAVYRFKYCKKCKEVKPPRTHHCSVCGKCVFRMDHHCPWVGNCVGLLNHKKFLLFLIYSFIGLQCVGWGTRLTGGQKRYQNLMYGGFFMSLSVGILMFFHLFLVLSNWTTLEMASFMAEINIFRH